uniref:Uncharacterized protein n=1 Tax=Lotus japonicus TaxID=34305 RepID=I3SBK9_LOTJA|nr:unknown [Lotus japonicus]
MLSSLALCKFSRVSSSSIATFSIFEDSSPFSFVPFCSCLRLFALA